ncbi:MAG: capsular polysaccharide biosynthesis protein [Lachnospiraceae bacterium]|nr:capsular polysaccharide biosynthesis protein [Lachnospiraceae bacterium]
MDQQTSLRKIEAGREEIQEIDLLDLFGYYLSKFPLLIAAIIIGGLAAGLITHYLIPDKFTAVSRMYMISASSDSVVDLSDLNIGASLSNDYVELMKGRPVVEDVIEQLGLDYTYEQLLNMINLTVVSNTRIVKISVTSTDPAEAMEIANQMAKTSKVELPKVMDAPSPSIAERAVMPTQKSSPSMTKNVMVGALAVLVLVLAILTIIYLMDDTIKTAEDVEREFGIMPLTVIPEGSIEGLKKTSDAVRHSRKYKNRKKGDKA